MFKEGAEMKYVKHNGNDLIDNRCLKIHKLILLSLCSKSFICSCKSLLDEYLKSFLINYLQGFCNLISQIIYEVKLKKFFFTLFWRMCM